MDPITELKQKLKGFSEKPSLALTAKVVSVTGEVCSIQLESGLVLSDVRLTATKNDTDEALIIEPLIGSEVLVLSQTGDLTGLYVIKINEAQKVILKKGAFLLEVDCVTGKVKLENNGNNLGSLIEMLIDIMKSAIIDTPNGPGSINAATQLQLENMKPLFNQLLNTN